MLREPVASLARADVAIATRSDQVEPAALEAIRTRVLRHSPRCVWATAVHAPAQLRAVGGSAEPLGSLRGRRCFVFSGIGNPGAFAATVESAGGQVAGRIDFPDHHAFTAEDVERLRGEIERLTRSDPALSGERGLLVLCTGKDLTKVNLQRIAGRPLYALDIELRLTSGEAEVDAALAQAVGL